MIEIFWKKIYIYIYPKTKYHLSLKKPSAVYVSRKSTVHETRKRIAEILHSNKSE
jgi:hypothetical protein